MDTIYVMDEAAKNKHFATWLVGAMQQAGVDEAELANRIGKTEAAVRYWVRGDRRPLRSTCRVIATALGADAANVMVAAFRMPGVIDGGDDEPEEENEPEAPTVPATRAQAYEPGGTNQLTSEELVRMRTLFAILEGLDPQDVRCLQALAQTLRLQRQMEGITPRRRRDDFES